MFDDYENLSDYEFVYPALDVLQHAYHKGVTWKDKSLPRRPCNYAKMMRTDQDWFEKRTKSFDSPFIVEQVGQRDEIEVGVMGLPEQATKELGEKICNEIIDNLVDYVDKLEEHRKNK